MRNDWGAITQNMLSPRAEGKTRDFYKKKVFPYWVRMV